jgi:hypothetical protein
MQGMSNELGRVLAVRGFNFPCCQVHHVTCSHQVAPHLGEGNLEELALGIALTVVSLGDFGG